MNEKQFELAGVRFGLDCPVEISGWTPGGPAIRSNNAENPQGDGVRPGRRFKGASTWSFSLYSNGDDEVDGWESLHPLAAAWNDDALREDPELVLPLRYRLAGRDRRVYGHPGRWTEVPTNLSLSGRVEVEADFELVHHVVYDDLEQSVEIPILPPLEADAGFVVPAVVPVSSSPGASSREKSIRIGGDRKTPITVKFIAGTGDLQQASIQIGDWTVALIDPVSPNDPVIADGRPWVNAVATESGGGVRVSPRVTRTSKMWLPPGDHAVIFRGVDPTSSASAVISWHDALNTLR